MDARWLALTVLTIARVSLGFQFQSLASVSPLLRQDFGISYADVGFLIGLYMSPGIFLAVPGGMLGQRFGDKRMVCFGLALMTLGGAVVGFAENYATILIGRLLSGAGGVLLNVLMTKMVTDWFAGREIVLAMAIFMNSFPIGIGLALLTLGWLAEVHGWQFAPHATAALALVSLLLVVSVYRQHVNDGQTNAAGPSGAGIRQREVVLVCIAGAIWGVYNGAHSIIVGFTPFLLVKAGLTVGTAGFWVGLSTWLVVLSVQIGGIVAQRWGHVNVLMVVSIFLWGACLLVLPSTDPGPVLVAIGLLQGLPVGVIMALPATALRSESRGIGMGVFFTGLYLGHAGLPPIAGWLQDLSGSADTSLYFAAALVFSILALFAAFRLFQRDPFVSVQPT
jgi:predicted MFS family arabinose efflux permease